MGIYQEERRSNDGKMNRDAITLLNWLGEMGFIVRGRSGGKLDTCGL
jgi:hypothetical protein